MKKYELKTWGWIIVICLVFILIVVSGEYFFNTKPINEDCKSFGYEGAYHSTRGWYCYRYIDEMEISTPYLNLKEQPKND